MGKKSGSGGGLVVTLATTVGVFLARKGLAAGWSRATGKTAPTDPADRSVGIAEAITFAAIAGVIGELVKLIVARAATRPEAASADSPEAA
jgi:hypothetical protein